MLHQLVSISALLVSVVFVFPVLVEGTQGSTQLPPHPPHPPQQYVWTITWTGPPTCHSWPSCTFSYDVFAPRYSSPRGSIAAFDAKCRGIVDLPLTYCDVYSPEAGAILIRGNFTSTGGRVGYSGFIDLTAFWIDLSGASRMLTAVTHTQSSKQNHGTWTAHPHGCPVTPYSYCAKPPIVPTGYPVARGRQGMHLY
ncbi:hypothetical protein HD806DRAFT_516524 [Xylariaceae sp. AK1471]|nr:hypothetical protein HD806DRAFT_516524 [Xylariaceae sp. AK1471]